MSELELILIKDFRNFCSFIDSTKTVIDQNNIVCDDDSLRAKLSLTSTSISNKTSQYDIVLEIELAVKKWIKQLENELVVSQQLRRETELSGPATESLYWRKIFIKFSFLNEQFHSSETQSYIEFLETHKSKLLELWKNILKRILAVKILAQDNMKYLNVLEIFINPLYRLNPKRIGIHLPSLMYSLQNIFSTSRFFNRNDILTSMFVKMTNQIILSCKSYLTDYNTTNIWDVPIPEMISRIKECVELNNSYHHLYTSIKQKMENVFHENTIRISEVHIFGKFHTFTQRIIKIVEILNISLSYSILNRSTIEGIHVFAQKFTSFFQDMISKEYDPLDFRRVTFELDFDEFKNNVLETQTELRNFFFSVAKQSTLHQNLIIIRRFQKFNFQQLWIDRKYIELFNMLESEIEDIRDEYNEKRWNPPVPRNIPIIPGRLLWIRQFTKRLTIIINAYGSRYKVITHEKVQKSIKLYNALMLVFTYYEILYHKAWCKTFEIVRKGLAVPLVSRNPKHNMYVVNFDPYIQEILREADYMLKFNLRVPDYIADLLNSTKIILFHYARIKNLIDNYNYLKQSIPSVFDKLIKYCFSEIEFAFQPCLSTINWSSLQIKQNCKKLSDVLQHLKSFLEAIVIIKNTRIDDVLESIEKTPMVKILPFYTDNESFIESMANYSAEIGNKQENKSSTIKIAVFEILRTFIDMINDSRVNSNMIYSWFNVTDYVRSSNSSSEGTGNFHQSNLTTIRRSDGADLKRLQADCVEFFYFINKKLIDAFVRCTKNSLELVKKIAGSSSTSYEFPNSENVQYIMQTDLFLKIPSISIVPTVDDLQNYFNKSVHKVLEANQYVRPWANESLDDISNGESDFYKQIVNHKEVIRCLMSLQGVILIFKEDVLQIVKSYHKFSYLWAETRDSNIESFVQTEPELYSIEDQFVNYESVITELRNLPNYYIVGSLRINTNQLKSGLLIEATWWKSTLGSKLLKKYVEKLHVLSDYIKDNIKQLGREIKDLEDVRISMLCLEKIRENFITIDRELMFIEKIYALILKFEIEISIEDQEIIESTRYNFMIMIKTAKEVHTTICNMQEPLKKELVQGINDFKIEISEFDKNFSAKGPMIEGISAKEASERVLLFQLWFDTLWEKLETYSSGEQLFGLTSTEYPILFNRKRELNLLQKLYSLYLQVMRSIDSYYEIPWAQIDIDVISTELANFQNKCRRLPKGLRGWPAYIELKKKIDDFNETCLILELMANKAVKDRHWLRISELCNYQFNVNSENFNLSSVMAAPILQFKDEVEDICISAIKEKDIESKLKLVISDWSLVDLQFANFKLRGELLLRGNETQDIIAKLEDALMILSSLATNRYNAPFKKEIQLWQSKLNITSEVLVKWLNVQNLWVYLEAVFVGGDIAKQLPVEAKRFNVIDKSWVKLMYRAREKVNAVETCSGDETMAKFLPHLLEQLELCQKSLSGYLEIKRKLFPRFCFISDPTLLEILGQAADTHTIVNYLEGFFDNVAKLDFSEKEYDKILAMYSREKEKIILEKPVDCHGGVEIWLNLLLQMHCQSVGAYISNGLQKLANPETDYLELINSSILQVALIAIQILWTQQSEIAFLAAKKDKYIMKKTNQWFLDFLNRLIEVTIKNLTSYERLKYETLITIHIHQRDIFDDLCKMRVKNVTDFEWLKQARFYYDNEIENVVIKITDIDFIYQNEFLGCTDRLVVTPLTDRCYITLSQAIGMNFGGAPVGPAGTGKTETTKDMGKALGKYVVVFNCSDQMDFRGLGRIFKGLVQSGTWGCFDEFNRIDLPVLSVAAQQITIVLTARKEKKNQFLFSDGEIYSIDYEFGLFITMNPGYAGRQELPENLKIMFRCVAMMVPDRQIIMRVKLAACGFKDNIILSRKFFTLYKLCEEQLSKQVHYDFGLRNILSCLRTLGVQKRAHPNETEEITLMRVLRDMNLSKLVDEDEPLFLSLIEDMFPGIKLMSQTYKDMQKAILNAVNSQGIVNHPDWNLKTIQLYETSLVRHGIMILGPTGSGKSQSMWTLMKSLTELGTPHKEVRMNPKAITASQMFGKLDVVTNDWTDGIFSTIWRKSMQIKKSECLWIVLDGPVDAIWIENLNSVLDDNKTLTLANGDRMIMAPNVKLIFECDNVDNASPATVSRMGMVFFSTSVLKWQPIFESWYKTRPAHQAQIFRECFDKLFEDSYEFLRTKLITKMKLLESMYIKQCINLLEGLLKNHQSNDVLGYRLIEKYFLFSLMWSIGAVLELDQRLVLQHFFMHHPSNYSWPKCQNDETIFEYFVSESGEWVHWRKKVPDFNYPKDSILDYYKILVPNIDNTRTLYLISLIDTQNKATLLIGEQGTGKTVMLKSYMLQNDPEYHLNKSFNFSSATTPNMVQRVFESYVEKRVGNIYGPPNGKKLSIFVDDINMPIINEWGDQVTNEIIRQMMEYKGFYSLDKPGDFLFLEDITLLAAMIHPGGGRNDIPPRLKRQFNIFNCTLPSNNSMDTIFGSIGQGYFCQERFSLLIVEFIPRLIPLTREIWQKTKIKMLPTPAKFHYIFNLRDLSRIWEGILRIKNPECPSIETVIKLWAHECNRVIADRFITGSDKEWFKNMLLQTAKTFLGVEFSNCIKTESYFVNFMRDPPEPTGDEPEDFVFEAPKVYEEVTNVNTVIARVESFINQFNEFIRGITLNLVLFNDALVHLWKISRILGAARGNAMLVGIGGSGKQSLTRLASFMAGFSFFQIILTRNYNIQNLMEDLRYLYRLAGANGKGVTFILTDNDIRNEEFLESINNILSVGEIANLYPKDELDDILNLMIPIMRKEDPNLLPTKDNLYDYFITKARNNLHIALCFSPVGENFRSRTLKFPGVISGCTVDWFSPWPKDALRAVSFHFLNEYKVMCSTDVKNQLIEVMGEVQIQVNDTCIEYYNKFHRRSYVTAKSFLCFIQAYKLMYKRNLESINASASGMSKGLNKLVDAAAQVDELRKVLVQNQQNIAVKNTQVETILRSVNEKRQEAETIKSKVQLSKDEAETLLKIIVKEKAIAEKKLQAAEPALRDAELALRTITASDIATVRKLAKPPYLITLIMDCVCILFGKKMYSVILDPDKKFLQASWTEALKVMSDTRFLYNLQNFPKDDINAEIIDLLTPYFSYPSYSYEAAKTACGNVAGLIQWTISMVSFYSINRDVLPLKAKLASLKNKHDRANRNLQIAEKLLKAKDEDLKNVKKEYDVVMDERQRIIDQAQLCQAKMDAARSMINGLSGERSRWVHKLTVFKSETENLVGDVIILTGFLSYCGSFNQEFRSILQKKWFNCIQLRFIPMSPHINIIESLTNSATIGEWHLQGLPNDDLSVQNGIIVTKALRYPLLIDPQLQGKMWILNKEKDFNLQLTALDQKYFLNHLEDCVSTGRPLLIQDVEEELDPVLDNLLEKNLIRVGSSLKVKLGDKEVDFHDDFNLYITTNLPNPSYSPEIFARACVIDFTVTIKGLEDQLLGRVIMTEKKELETERTKLLTDVMLNKKKVIDLEYNLLQKLTTVQGPLIEDLELMYVLNKTKQTAAEVNEKLLSSKETEEKIDKAREEFRPVATRGSVLYFLICDMALVNCMYQTSLVQFLERFDSSVDKSESSPVNQKRIQNIIEYMTFEIFKYKARCLYEIHKAMFRLLMVLKIDLQRNLIGQEEFFFFLKGGAALDLKDAPKKPVSCNWITEVVWLNLVALSSLKSFHDILPQVEISEKNWRVWFESDAPEENPFPDNFNDLDAFRQLLLIRAWCLDRMLFQSEKYISSSMGDKYVDPVVALVSDLYQESRPETPIICLLSMGSDPTNNIKQLSKKMEIPCKSISMGQGQEIHARKLINSAVSEGFWVLFQNCHLGLEYMLELFNYILELMDPHEDFRIWITTEPHENFPISLLQISLKFTCEPPQGIKAGLFATYNSMDQSMLDQCDAKQYIPLIYTISFLHTIFQERRKFCPLGWNIPYEFNSSDWLASCLYISNYLNDNSSDKEISWPTLRYMISEVLYGGRVTDDYDKRLLNTFTKVWLSDSILDNDFAFYTGYKVVVLKQVTDYTAKIKEMRSIDPPQAYGLHSNADISYQTNTAQQILDTILSIQPKDSIAEKGLSRESVVAKQARDMLDKLPPSYDPFETRERLRILGHTTPMVIFLKQEIDRIQIVINLVKATLSNLILAIEGVIIMNENLRNALDSIFDAKIPDSWKSKSWESSTLGFWFTELTDRNQQFSQWLFFGRPHKFWMTGFFNPQGFLTAMKQEVTRMHKGWALDGVVLHNDVTKYSPDDIKSSPPEGVYVYGLFLEGAGWDRKNCKLTEAINKILYTSIPVIHIYALYNKAEKNTKLYICPVYKKPARTDRNFITSLFLQTEKVPDFWTLRGVALLCDIK